MGFPGVVFEGLNLEWWKIFHFDLRGTTFRRVSLNGAYLSSCQCDDATFDTVDLGGTMLVYSSFKRCSFENCILTQADLTQADLTEARLKRCDLIKVHLVETVLKDSRIEDCSIYGAAVWNVDTTGSVQNNLRITSREGPLITVDDLETAQFLHLLIANKKLRRVIDSLTSKVVLLLGRFTQERKEVLDAVRSTLREMNLIPVMFDFEKPQTRDTLETVTLLARLARFVFADLTDPRCIPQELTAIVRDLPSVPVIPVLQSGAKPWGMWDSISRYSWVLPVSIYSRQEDLLNSLPGLLQQADELRH
jgi:hypothetical protein